MKRKLIFHIHHAAVDGVGLSMIAGTILTGAGLEALVEAMPSAAKAGASSSGARGSGLKDACDTVSSLNKHGNTPFQGCISPKPEISITDPTSFAEVENIRYVHLGPFSVPALKKV